MVEVLVAHSGARVAADEEGWFLLLEEKTCGEEGEAHGGCFCCLQRVWLSSIVWHEDGKGIGGSQWGWSRCRRGGLVFIARRKNLWRRGTSSRWMLLLPMRLLVGEGGWVVVVHDGAEMVMAEEAAERGGRDWWREEEKTGEKAYFFKLWPLISWSSMHGSYPYL